MTYVDTRFPTWGAGGQRPVDNFQYTGGQQVSDTEINYLWSRLRQFENRTITALDDIDADADGRVDAADTTALLKDNDIDSNGDGVVDDADNAVSTYRGSDLDTEYSTGHFSGDLDVGETAYVYTTTVADGDTIEILDETTVSGNGTSTPLSPTITTIDGPTHGTSFSNSSGGPTDVAVAVTNNSGSATSIVVQTNTRVY